MFPSEFRWHWLPTNWNCKGGCEPADITHTENAAGSALNHIFLVPCGFFLSLAIYLKLFDFPSVPSFQLVGGAEEKD